MIVLGLDPGGAKAFGWAILTGTFEHPQLVAGGVGTGAQETVDEARRSLGEEPIAIGIDAPLFWSSQGDRRADAFVRTLVCSAGGRSGTVNHVNSLRGACLVEGALAAHLVHNIWPRASITEVHPKALLAISAEARAFATMPSIQGHGHHLRDAALGALSALAMAERRANWQDLVALEPDVLFPLDVRAQYWFPQTCQPLPP